MNDTADKTGSIREMKAVVASTLQRVKKEDTTSTLVEGAVVVTSKMNGEVIVRYAPAKRKVPESSDTTA